MDETIAVIGGSGFLGKHLVTELTRTRRYRLKVLSRTQSDAVARIGTGLEVTCGDLMVPESLRGFAERDCIVINLAYSRSGEERENLQAIANLLESCKAAGIRRLVHCSTADVVGRGSRDWISEYTPCFPRSAYGITKLKIERLVLEAARKQFDVVVLRPTAIFGPGGLNLVRLTDDLTSGKWVHNYLKSCLFGNRRGNLVYVRNVVSAILFCAARSNDFGGEVYFVSEDDCPLNNFVDIERILMRELGVPDYALPRVQLPKWLLRGLLRIRGRENDNPNRSYDPGRLIGLGFKRPATFEAGLRDFASWYQSERIHRGQKGNN